MDPPVAHAAASGGNRSSRSRWPRNWRSWTITWPSRRSTSSSAWVGQHRCRPAPCRQLPAMALQLLVENAIKHGIASPPRRWRDRVRPRWTAMLRLQVDNRWATPASSPTGMVLALPTCVRSSAHRGISPTAGRRPHAGPAGDSTMSAMLRVLIVDDARLARQGCARCCRRCRGCSAWAGRHDVPAAREAIATLAPDLVLLDVQMPSAAASMCWMGWRRCRRWCSLLPTTPTRCAPSRQCAGLSGEAGRGAALAGSVAAGAPARGGGGRTPGRRAAPGPGVRARGPTCWFVAVSEIRRLVVDGELHGCGSATRTPC